MITLNMTRVVQHIWEAIRFENTERLELVLDQDQPVRSTGDMATWYTGRPCTRTNRSHINVCVHDGSWEAAEAFELDRNALVAAWVKNDHLDFDVLYIHNGVVRKYRPDFIIRMDSGRAPGAGSEGTGQRGEPDEAAVPGGVGQRGERSRGLWAVGLRTCPGTRRISRTCWRGKARLGLPEQVDCGARRRLDGLAVRAGSP